MGFFDSFKSSLLKVGHAVAKSPIGKALDFATVAVARPISTFKAVTGPTKIKDVQKDFFSQPVKSQVGQVVKSGVIAAATVLSVGAVAGAAKAGTLGSTAARVGTKLIPTTTKGKIIGAIAAPVVLGAVIREPTKTASAVVKTPGALANFGGNIAGFAAAPSKESAKTIFKDNPVISSVVGAGLIATAGAGVAAGVGGILNRQEQKKQTAALERTAAAAEQPIDTGKYTVVDKSQGFGLQPAPISPTLPLTKTQTTTPTKRRKYTKKATKPTINNNVRIQIANKSTSTGMKNYIKRKVLAY